MMSPAWTLRRLHGLDSEQIEELADVLIDCVEGGASVSFMLPLSRERALAFCAGRREAWPQMNGRSWSPKMLTVFAAQCNWFSTCRKPTSLADLSKMLVAHRGRRQGLGAAPMRAAESLGRECGRTLLVLDAVTGGDAARLYERRG